jgi:hypothetical protein
MGRKFRIDDINFYAWALKQDWPSMPDGYDSENDHEMLEKLASDHKKTPQASLETIDGELEDELQLDATHQRKNWLWLDRAIEAVGMLEADGFDLGKRGKLFSSNYYTNHKKYSKKNAFISLVKPNLDTYKDQLSQSNIEFKMVPNDPKQDSGAISAVNDFTTEIKNDNNFEQQKDMVEHDGAAYGSGVWHVSYDEKEANPDDMFLEENLKDGVPIKFDDFMRMKRLTKAHQLERVDTFEIIAHRNASGQGSWDFDDEQHPYLHRVRQIRVARAKRDYTDHKNKITSSTSDVYRETNPKSFVLDKNDEDMVTLKETWIKFPVNYDVDVPIEFADGTVEEHTMNKDRQAICYVARLEGVGIVDMSLDYYKHNRIPFVQWVNFPSTKHSRGIGLCKYGYAPQKVHTIMFNGKLRFFDRMVKGGGFFLKGVMTQDEIEKRTREHSWIGIDVNELPPELQDKPINQLVYDNRPQNFPSVYDRLEAQTERYINTSMNIPPSKKGFQQGSSGRQDLALINQSDQSASPGVKAVEAAQLPVGEMLHSNIVQFDGDKENITFYTEDEKNPGDFKTQVLNKVMAEAVEYDLYADENDQWAKWKIYPTLVKNSIKSLRYSTQIASRSIVPSNPTERRFFFQNLLQSIQGLIESKRGITTLKWTNQFGFGGIPGFDQFIGELEQSINEDRQFQQQMAQKQEQREAQQQQFEQSVKTEELRQNLIRLRQNAQNEQEANQIDALSEILSFIEGIHDDEENVDSGRLQQLIGQARANTNTGPQRQLPNQSQQQLMQ